MPRLVERILREAHQALTPRRPRRWENFAEEEVVLTSGPRKGLYYRRDVQPYSQAIFDAYNSTWFWRFFLSGPGQDGKTLHGFIIPALYEIFELQHDVILGAPVVKMAQDAWADRLLPSIEATRYRDFLPRTGGGSRGGNSALSIKFRNGPILRFMGAGGGDSQRSYYTAPTVIMTELDKMDDSGSASEEADPVTQMEERSSSFRAYGMARTYGECTMSTKRGRIYQEIFAIGTDSKLMLPCPHCRVYCYPERKSFTGWQDAKEVEEARAKGAFFCPGCAKPWTEEERQRAVREYRVVARGQTVSKEGVVEGGMPNTRTFGFRWNTMASVFKNMADIGEAEWLAERAETEAKKKAVLQFRWAEPYEGEKLDLVGLTREIVISKATQIPKGTAPADAIKVTVFIDVGLYLCWWAAVAWRPGAKGHVLDYGAIEVPQERQPDPVKILPALHEFYRTKLIHGWHVGERQRAPDLLLVDSGWQHDVVYEFTRETPRCLPSKGFGSSKKDHGRWRVGRKAGPECDVGNGWAIVLQKPAGVWLVEINTDYWKGEVHDGFSAPPGAPGSLTLFHADGNFHRGFARHITAEQRKQEFVQGEGVVTWWEVLRDDNHHLDCMVGNRAAADILGIRKVEAAAPPAARSRNHDDDERPGLKSITTKY